MVLLIDSSTGSISDVAFRSMFAARKSVFIDLLKWDLPVLEGRYEIDQFDDAHGRLVRPKAASEGAERAPWGNVLAEISGATLGDDEFAFHFDTPRGIDAQRLGLFLQRAAKVARDNGADLRIVAIQEGSLDVVARVTKATARKVGDEFAANPVKTTAASSVLVGVVIKGLAMVMAPSESGATPLAKAGAEIVEKEPVQSITIVSQGGQVIVMNPVIAGEVRRAERRYQAPRLPS